ncbi:ankyrin repeat domain-containing protein [Tenacibaculum sp. M341]|uniref:ankyrin repeat domain-containing protein n=1 Tax=Tenacibaculum sp. M341 TaxID=2530339 RepID=UPI00104788EB|nr:ankyrin repeat domain-containing protein [Tenacibaculum sp. M341]TCI91378.1 ankyrin repeat domain-containing protein [Tenacibaculum sp. M341]
MKKNIFLIFILLSNTIIYCQKDIFQYSREGDTAAIEVLYKENPEIINSVNNKGFSPLILAVYNDQEETVRFLLKNKVNTEAQGMHGNTALMGACFKGYLNIVKLLMMYKADVNKKNYNNATALIYAATFGHTEIVKELLKNGADVNLKDSRGNTALDHAIMQDNKEVVEALK